MVLLVQLRLHPKLQFGVEFVGNLAEIENRIEKDLGCKLSNLVEYNTYENGTLTLFHYEIHTIYRH
jgi:hypothetical protein